MNLIKPKTALISLSDKTNLDELVKFLLEQNVKMISTGGTFQAIRNITDKWYNLHNSNTLYFSWRTTFKDFSQLHF